MFETILIDLDETLYPSSSGLWDKIRDRMNLFMLEKLKIPESEVGVLREDYYRKYGTTMRGLLLEHNIDPEEYLTFVHDLTLDQYLSSDPKLEKALRSIEIDKWIFTNASHDHAERVISILGIEDMFLGVIDVGSMGYLCKPFKTAYRIAMKIANRRDPKKIIVVEDSIRNLAGAKKEGMSTILIGGVDGSTQIDVLLDSIYELPTGIEKLINTTKRRGED